MEVSTTIITPVLATKTRKDGRKRYLNAQKPLTANQTQGRSFRARNTQLNENEDPLVAPKIIKCLWGPDVCGFSGGAHEVLEHVFQPKGTHSQELGVDKKTPVCCRWGDCQAKPQRENLSRHMRSAHTLDIVRMCIHCGVKKRQDSYLKSHGLARDCLLAPVNNKKLLEVLYKINDPALWSQYDAYLPSGSSPVRSPPSSSWSGPSTPFPSPSSSSGTHSSWTPSSWRLPSSSASSSALSSPSGGSLCDRGPKRYAPYPQARKLPRRLLHGALESFDGHAGEMPIHRSYRTTRGFPTSQNLATSYEPAFLPNYDLGVTPAAPGYVVPYTPQTQSYYQTPTLIQPTLAYQGTTNQACTGDGFDIQPMPIYEPAYLNAEAYAPVEITAQQEWSSSDPSAWWSASYPQTITAGLIVDNASIYSSAPLLGITFDHPVVDTAAEVEVSIQRERFLSGIAEPYAFLATSYPQDIPIGLIIDNDNAPVYASTEFATTEGFPDLEAAGITFDLPVVDAVEEPPSSLLPASTELSTAAQENYDYSDVFTWVFDPDFNVPEPEASAPPSESELLMLASGSSFVL